MKKQKPTYNNFEEWWKDVGSFIELKVDEEIKVYAKNLAKIAIVEMNKQLFENNQKINSFLILGDNKKPDNYRAEGWFQFSNEITKWLDE